MLVEERLNNLKCLRWHMESGSSTRLTLSRYNTLRHERFLHIFCNSAMVLLNNINVLKRDMFLQSIPLYCLVGDR
jgi:hypothetical protein